MDRSAVIALIEREQDAVPTALDELCFSTTNPKLEGHESGLAVKLYDYFNADPSIASLELGNDTNKIDLASFAAWAVQLVEQRGPVGAANTLATFLETGRAKATPDMHLAKIEDFRPSEYGQSILSTPAVKLFDAVDRPNCVLSMTHDVRGLVLSPEQQAERETNGTLFYSDHGAREMMAKIAACLCLIGPHPVIRICDWCELDEHTAPPGLEPEAHAGLERFPFPTFGRRSGAFDSDRCRQLVTAFRQLSAAQQTRIMIPINRLNRAIRAHLDVDRALDLGIALKALIDPGGNKIAEKIATQGAARLIDGDESKRADFHRQLKGLYGSRSSAAHSGRVPPDQRAALEEGILVAAELIRREIFTPTPTPSRSRRARRSKRHRK